MDSLKVSADDSDSEDDINFQTAKIFILPLVNAHNEKGDIILEITNWECKYFSGNQLLGAANLQISTPSGQVTTRYEGELSNKNETNRQLSVKSHQANICQQL